MTSNMPEARKEYVRYLDVDGDGIPFRTYPGTHPSKGAYFTRGTSRNPQAVYSELGPDYQYNMERLLKKFDFAKTLVPKPVLTPAKEPARLVHRRAGGAVVDDAEARRFLGGREDGLGHQRLREVELLE